MTVELQTILISGGVSLLLSITTAFITSRFTLRQDVKKRIYDKREETYISLFDLLQKLNDDHSIYCNTIEFYKPLMDLRVKLNLYASAKLIKVFEPFYNTIKSEYERYMELFDGPEYEQRKANLMEYEGQTEIDFEHEIECYLANAFSNIDFSIEIKKVVDAMRMDLGTR